MNVNLCETPLHRIPYSPEMVAHYRQQHHLMESAYSFGLCCVAVVEIVANDVLDFVVCGVNAEVVVVIVVVIAGPSSNDDANDVMETNSTGCGAVTFVVIVAGVIVVVVVIVVIAFVIVVKQGNEGSVPAAAAAEIRFRMNEESLLAMGSVSICAAGSGND
ncbi:hypothetical protein GQX74_007969 [Glossina fuscipes]|nr:hypothetical protein GQX74_007969 [Glossina fuscipes]